MAPFDWAIIGGESGNESGPYTYRPCTLPMIESLVKTLQAKNVPVFVKQMGTYLAKGLNLKDRHGADVKEFPEHLKIQQFPKQTKIYYEQKKLSFL